MLQFSTNNLKNYYLYLLRILKASHFFGLKCLGQVEGNNYTIFGHEPSLTDVHRWPFKAKSSTWVVKYYYGYLEFVKMTRCPALSASVHFLFTDEKYLPSLLPSIAFQILRWVFRRAGKCCDPPSFNRQDYSTNSLGIGLHLVSVWFLFSYFNAQEIKRNTSSVIHINLVNSGAMLGFLLAPLKIPNTDEAAEGCLFIYSTL